MKKVSTTNKKASIKKPDLQKQLEALNKLESQQIFNAGLYVLDFVMMSEDDKAKDTPEDFQRKVLHMSETVRNYRLKRAQLKSKSKLILPDNKIIL